MIYLVRLCATQCIVSNATFISEECTGKDLEGIGIKASNNTTVSTLTPRSKENTHLH